MCKDIQRAKEDLGYLRAIAEGDSRYLAHNGAILVAIGTIFGLGVLRIWAVESSLIAWPTQLRALIPWDMIGLFVVAVLAINRRYSNGSPGPKGRAFTAAWAGVGWGMTAAVVALAIGSFRLGNSVPILGTFPILLLSFYGSAWLVVYAILRRGWYLALALSSYTAAVASGIWMTTSTQWLVLGLGIIVCAGLPGIALLRAATPSDR